ncbi:MAG: hypothetical protein WA954_12160 [Parerythrobacter sp.]
MTLEAGQRTLIQAGAVLFLLGLLQGAVVQDFANPRMALSAHLTAVQSGTALMVTGAVWRWASLSPLVSGLARWAIIVGMYMLWIGLTGAAITGASSMVPIAGAGYRADAGTEQFISALVLAGSGAMTLGWLLFVIGLFRQPPDL